jgi:hypothetical protein
MNVIEYYSDLTDNTGIGNIASAYHNIDRTTHEVVSSYIGGRRLS